MKENCETLLSNYLCAYCSKCEWLGSAAAVNGGSVSAEVACDLSVEADGATTGWVVHYELRSSVESEVVSPGIELFLCEVASVWSEFHAECASVGGGWSYYAACYSTGSR